MKAPADPLLPDGQLRGRQPPARSRAALRAVGRAADELDHLRPPRLPGLRRGARRALRARRGDARHQRQLIAANATGCLEVFSTPYPETSWRIPWIHSLFGNAPAVATGIAAALRAKGREDVRVVGQGGDGGTVDIGFGVPVGDVRAQRRRALHLLRQRGLHEHRRAALRRDAARRAHRHDAGRRPGTRERVRPGQERAADRDGARDPLRRDRHGRRAARPRGQGPDRDGDPRRALPARLRPLPARLGIAPRRTRSGSRGWRRRRASSRCSRRATAR